MATASPSLCGRVGVKTERVTTVDEARSKESIRTSFESQWSQDNERARFEGIFSRPLEKNSNAKSALHPLTAFTSTATATDAISAVSTRLPNFKRVSVSEAKERGDAVDLLFPRAYQFIIAVSFIREANLDLAAIFLDENLVTRESIWFKKQQNIEKSVVHSRNDGSEETSDRITEIINIDLSAIPQTVQYILCVTSLYQHDLTFADIGRVSVHVMKRCSSEAVVDSMSYELKNDLWSSSVVVGCLVRVGTFWKFTQLSRRASGRTAPQFLRNHENFDFLKSDGYLSLPHRRRVSVSVFRFIHLTSEENSASDMNLTYVMSYEGRTVTDDYVTRTGHRPGDVRALIVREQEGSGFSDVDVTIFDCGGDSCIGQIRIEAETLARTEPGENFLQYKLRLDKTIPGCAETISGDLILKISTEYSTCY